MTGKQKKRPRHHQHSQHSGHSRNHGAAGPDRAPQRDNRPPQRDNPQRDNPQRDNRPPQRDNRPPQRDNPQRDRTAARPVAPKYGDRVPGLSRRHEEEGSDYSRTPQRRDLHPPRRPEHGPGNRSEHGPGNRSEQSVASNRRDPRPVSQNANRWRLDQPPKAKRNGFAPSSRKDDLGEDDLRKDDLHVGFVPTLYDEDLPEPDDETDDDTSELGIGSRVVPPHVRYEAEVSAPSRPPSSAPPRDVEAQIRALEARLDGLIHRANAAEEDAQSATEEDAQSAAEEDAQIADRHAPAAAPPTTNVEELSAPADGAPTGYAARQWSREALRSRFEDVDELGLDPAFERKLMPAIDLLYRRYFRIKVEGIENVPVTGRAVVIANHSGTLPLDGAMLRAAMRLDHPGARDLRWLAEDFIFHLPFAGVLLNRIGAVRACPENAERLLDKDALIAVFPEGVQGIKKLFSERYRLQRFGRGGYIRLCLRMRAPLVPCAIIGAEETNPLVYRFEWLAELFKLPYLPITPTFPWLGPLGLLPAPTRWKMRFGEPISFESYGPEAADDDLLIGRLSERVRSSIQSLLDTGLRDRKSVWFG